MHYDLIFLLLFKLIHSEPVTAPGQESTVPFPDGQQFHFVEVLPAVVQRHVAPLCDVFEPCLHVVLRRQHARLQRVYRCVYFRHPVRNYIVLYNIIFL